MNAPATPEPLIRRAQADDADALAALGADTFVATFGHLYAAQDLQAFLADTHTRAAHLQLLRDPAQPVWVAADDAGRLLGYVGAGPCKLPVDPLPPRAGEIRRLYVRAEAQGRQLGSRLLQTALDWLQAQAMQPVFVGVWSENTDAQRLYARFGFGQVGEYEFPVGAQRDREFILRRG